MTMIGNGISGLNAAQSGLAATSHNIANVSTPGYSRQKAVQTTNTPNYSGAGYVGQGANVTTIVRSYSNFLELQAREAQSQASQFNSLSGKLADIDQMFSDATAGLSPALSDFFRAVGTLSANPADGAARAVLVSGGEVLAGRFRDLSGRLDALRTGLNEQISLSVGSINAAAARIAELNTQIVRASGAGGQPPNDLMDERDALLRDMAKEIRISTATTADGSISVSLSNGQPVVLDRNAFAIAARPDPLDARNTTVGIEAGGSFMPFGETILSGGALGGALVFRSQALDMAVNALGRAAGALATALNAQHAVGQDRNGNPGGALFSFAGARIEASTRNSGTALLAVAVTNYDAVTTSDYRVDFDGANYQVLRLADNTAQTYASLPQAIDGFTLSLVGGAPAAGDSFKVMPTRASAAGMIALITDPQKLAAGLPVRGAAAVANSGNGSLRVEGVTPPANPNVAQSVTITFTSATSFDVTGVGTGNPTGLAYVPGMTLAYNGWSATLAGGMGAGDTFAVGPNINGSGDNANLLALGKIAGTRMLAGGSLTAGEAYAQAVGNLGNQTRAAAIGAKGQDAVLAQATAAQQAVSGVNLDEEAANLLKYQQAYQASSRVISIANSLFAEIIGIMR